MLAIFPTSCGCQLFRYIPCRAKRKTPIKNGIRHKTDTIFECLTIELSAGTMCILAEPKTLVPTSLAIKLINFKKKLDELSDKYYQTLAFIKLDEAYLFNPLLKIPYAKKQNANVEAKKIKKSPASK